VLSDWEEELKIKKKIKRNIKLYMWLTIALFSSIKKRFGCLVFIFINNPGIDKEVEETIESFVFVCLFFCFCIIAHTSFVCKKKGITEDVSKGCVTQHGSGKSKSLPHALFNRLLLYRKGLCRERIK